MTEVTRPSEKVGGKRRMTDEEDGDDMEDATEDGAGTGREGVVSTDGADPGADGHMGETEGGAG